MGQQELEVIQIFKELLRSIMYCQLLCNHEMFRMTARGGGYSGLHRRERIEKGYASLQVLFVLLVPTLISFKCKIIALLFFSLHHYD